MKMKTEVEGILQQKDGINGVGDMCKGRKGHGMKEDTCVRTKGDGYEVLLWK